MGARKIDKEFFANKDNEFLEKRAELIKLKKDLSKKVDNGAPENEFNRSYFFLKTYCDITEGLHPNEKMPEWWENTMRYHSINAGFGL